MFEKFYNKIMGKNQSSVLYLLNHTTKKKTNPFNQIQLNFGMCMDHILKDTKAWFVFLWNEH